VVGTSAVKRLTEWSSSGWSMVFVRTSLDKDVHPNHLFGPVIWRSNVNT
jgi:hypothetical protein